VDLAVDRVFVTLDLNMRKIRKYYFNIRKYSLCVLGSKATLLCYLHFPKEKNLNDSIYKTIINNTGNWFLPRDAL